MNTNQKRKISIIFGNHNGLRFLKEFLDSVYLQTYKNFEIIMVDNVSVDTSIDFVSKNFPSVKIIANKKDLGFAGGSNIGFNACSGDYVAIANNDIILQSDLLEKLMEAYNDIPNLGAVQPKVELKKQPGKLDACGSFWTNTGFNYHYGIYKDANLPIYNNRIPIYSLKGVFMLMPRSVIEKVGLFDDDFWCFFEETDFCHRVWLAGYECWYYPGSMLYHNLGGTLAKERVSYVQFHSFKNRLCSYLKNLGLIEALKVLPVYLLLNIILSISYLAKLNFANFLMIYKAILWNVVNLGNTMRKRSKVQKNIRIKTDKEIFKKVRRNPRASYYYYLLKGLEHYVDD